MGRQSADFDFDNALVLVQMWRRYGRTQNSVFYSMVLLVHAIRLLHAFPPDVQTSRPQQSSGILVGGSIRRSKQLIRLFDSSHLNIGDLFYDPNPVGILVGGSRRARLTGRHEPPRCGRKRMRVNDVDTAGFDHT